MSHKITFSFKNQQEGGINSGTIKKVNAFLSFSLKLSILTFFLISQSFLADIFLYQNSFSSKLINIARANNAVSLHNAINGSQTSSNTSSETIILPAYSAGDTIIVIVSRNQASSSWTGDSNCSVQTLALGAGNLSVLKIIPNGSPSSFVLTASGTGIWRWWIASYSGVDTSLTISATASDTVSNTTSAIAVPTVSLGFISSAGDYAISAAGVNSTATWTTDGNTLYNNTSGNASLLVSGKTISANITAATFSVIDRGQEATSKQESSVSLVLPAAGDAKNLLVNPSFELGTTIATNWNDEHTTIGAATYSLPATGVVDGDKAQKIVYNGQAGDGGIKILEIYQAPIGGVVVGNVLKFSVYLSGTLTNAPTIIGVEAFNSSNAYISESDSYITNLSGTPSLYEVTYACPANTDHVAVYMQSQEIGLSSAISITLDSARLVLVNATPTFSPTAGTYTSTQSVTVSTATNGATVCYTTDNSTPTTNGAGTCQGGTTQTYSTAISVSSSETVKAVATKSGMTDSSLGSAAYTIAPHANTSTGFTVPTKPVIAISSNGSIDINNLSPNITQIAISRTSDFKSISWQAFDKDKFKNIDQTTETLYVKFRTDQGAVSDVIIYTPQAANQNNAIILNEGDIVKTPTNPDVYIIKYKNGKQYKRLILSPLVFKSYGHLKWSNIKIISQEQIDSYTTSNLVKETKDTITYELFPEGDNGKRKPLDISKSYDTASVYEINKTDRGSYTLVK